MFQTFDVATNPKNGPPRLAALRCEMKAEGLNAFLIPRADAHQGEYVCEHDQRLAWLTGFTGSAGFCAALMDQAGLFVDGRYTLQVRDQTDLSAFEPVAHPTVKLADWLADTLKKGVVGFDPWLHTRKEIKDLEENFSGTDLSLKSCDNLVDCIWHNQPAPPKELMVPHDLAYAGVPHDEKRKILAKQLKSGSFTAAVLTQPDAIAWLLNTRGSDLGQVPVALAFAILHADGVVDLFMDLAKTDRKLSTHLGPEIRLSSPDGFQTTLKSLQGRVLVDETTAPVWVWDQLTDPVHHTDPTTLPRACKNETEQDGARAAHLRDGAAVCEFLAWLDDLGHTPDLTEIDVVKKLEGFRRATGHLKNISFDTISGTGPNGAIVHYKVNEQTNRKLATGDLLLVDSGAQYLDGTTDITRVIPIGDPKEDERNAFTLVLKGMINLSCLKFPEKTTGQQIDAIARAPLWASGRDFDHGTGHGVGSYLSVHEGPQRISKVASAPLKPGMILSNEPGYYREGAFGIRIENLVLVYKAPIAKTTDERQMLAFETLTFVPIDRRLIDERLFTPTERGWLNLYHAEVLAKIGPLCSKPTRAWLHSACKAI